MLRGVEGIWLTKSAAFEPESVPFPQEPPGRRRIALFADGAGAELPSEHSADPYPTLSTTVAPEHDPAEVVALTSRMLACMEERTKIPLVRSAGAVPL